MNMYDAKKQANKTMGTTICNALKENGFIAQYAENKKEAKDLSLTLIKREETVGIPGSVTVREIGLVDALTEQGNKIYSHWEASNKTEDKNQCFIDELTSNWYVMSTNALTLQGVLVNIDGTGNRVGAMSWAPGKLLIIAGINKIVPDMESAIKRIRNFSTPSNAQRLDIKTPCAVGGRCFDCKAPNRLCRVTTIMDRAPFGRECHVIIVGEELGY
ncbi:MAG: lactate utilization protein [Synergistaceae bacterium]